ncbi:MAG: DUF2332 family protein [Myxococcales bacterium]|nr:DUF2332 family protein [Myxococcales bacterium]MCB9732207.1 DUF2332 family protein [Deltaproteobacteria bacterium]
MPTGITGLADDLMSPRLLAEAGPGSYDRLLALLRALRDDERLLAPLRAAWEGREFHGIYARPLLVLAALRYLALGDDAHPLGPEVLADAEAPALEARLLEALADPALVPILRARHIQTNEPGRALGWGLVALALDLPHRGFALCEIGSSAGLNLVADLAPFDVRFGNQKVSTLDFPSPWRRVGLDRAPVDVRDADASRWLTACIWPGQPDRLARFSAAADVWRRRWLGDAPPPELRAHELGEGATAAILTDLEADERVSAVLAFESVVDPHLDPDVRERYHAEMRAWVAGGARRLWVDLNPAPPDPRGAGSGPMRLRVHGRSGGDVVAFELARTDYHPTGCVLAPGALARLKALWSAA